jgi:hypothetical protein
MSALIKLIEPWLFEADSDDLITLRDHLLWLQKELFDEYEPNRYESFDDRIVEWLLNVDDGDDRKSLFRMLNHLFFVGKQQFDSLCRAAFTDQTTRWIIDQANLNISESTLSSSLSMLVRDTWFCPITDSMRINSFLKLNGLRGHDHRPDWRSLEVFGSQPRLQNYVASEGIQRLVLLEDFVGTGNQLASCVRWAAETLPALPILVIPLVCCPRGIGTGAQLSTDYPNVTFSPTLTLRPELFLREAPQPDEPEIFSRVREVIMRIRVRLDGWEHHPFGYEATGALVALYSNCPDNTLPLIHHEGADWAPLFPRIRRS